MALLRWVELKKNHGYLASQTGEGNIQYIYQRETASRRVEKEKRFVF